ncbi:MAG: hypothetical protein Q8S31_06205 [Alphaproteobacteria bacterium]|nr:hypothetical protein [Alphaproteobacteria bacterium]
MSFFKIIYGSIIISLVSFSTLQAVREPDILKNQLNCLKQWSDGLVKKGIIMPVFHNGRLGPNFLTDDHVISLYEFPELIIWEPNNMMPDLIQHKRISTLDAKDLFYVNYFLYLKTLCEQLIEKEILQYIDYMLYVYDYAPIAYPKINEMYIANKLTDSQLIDALKVMAALGHVQSVKDLVDFYRKGEIVGQDISFASKLEAKIQSLERDDVFKEFVGR